MPQALGLDFGTTNTVMSQVGPDGAASPLGLQSGDGTAQTLRSVLCFWRSPEDRFQELHVESGPAAVREFIEHPDDSRFIQSLKTFAASEAFQGTTIYGQRFQFEDLLATFLGRTLHYAKLDPAAFRGRLVVGRPVTFAGTRPDDGLAMRRYETALRSLGFEDIVYVYEPVAAAFSFAHKLESSATLLVADFGGGTTDYSILRFAREGGTLRATPLAWGGVGVAGDRFDYQIIDNVILPLLGKGSRYRSMGKRLDLPLGVFSSFASWSRLSFLKGTPEFRDLKRLVGWCLEQEQVQRLIDLVEDNQGYALYKAVSEAKARLSAAAASDFTFPPLGADFSVALRRKEFEAWIAPELERIVAGLEETLRSCGLDETGIDGVFLTGGTSFVPAVRRIFETRFGAAKLHSGDELLSVANGLALIGERDDLDQWRVQTDAAQDSASTCRWGSFPASRAGAASPS